MSTIAPTREIFSKTFYASDFVVRDNVNQLAPATLFEMALAAAAVVFSGQEVTGLKTLELSAIPPLTGDNLCIRFEVLKDQKTIEFSCRDTCFARFQVALNAHIQGERRQLPPFPSDATQDFYETHAPGPCFRVVDQYWTRGDTTWAHLSLPAELQASFAHFKLHPSLMQGLLQVLERQAKPLPREFQLPGPFSSSLWLCLRDDVVLLDDQGHVVLRGLLANTETALEQACQNWLTNMFQQQLQIDENIDPLKDFEAYGLDSFLSLRVIKLLEQQLGAMPKTLLFEQPSLAQLVTYLVTHHPKPLAAHLCVEETRAEPERVVPVAEASTASHDPKPTVCSEARVLAEKNLNATDKAIVAELLEQYAWEAAALARHLIAPLVFLGAHNQALFYANQADGILFAFCYVGPPDLLSPLTEELCEHARQAGLEVAVLAEQALSRVGAQAFVATPFGVMQRLTDLAAFSLEGKPMRRLRYLVNKFARQGQSRTVEHIVQPNAEANRIAEVIDAWCESKDMVNPYVADVKRQLLDGTLDQQHRVFLTYLDQQLMNVVILTRMYGQRGYLMDLEFYPPHMPLGGLEAAICHIIELLAAEGVSHFSLGATFGAREQDAPNPCAESEALLQQLRERRIFDGAGNLQFKNKFRPNNKQAYLNRPAGSNAARLTDIILMIASPGPREQPTQVLQQPTVQAVQPPRPEPVQPASAKRLEPFEQLLRDCHYNPLRMPPHLVPHDLKTDSWGQLDQAYINEALDRLDAHFSGNIETLLAEIFPHKHLIPVSSGRLAEHLFWRHTDASRPLVLQNLMFPTFNAHMIEAGFQPMELPQQAVFNPQHETRFKGGIDLEAVAQQIAQGRPIGYVCVEPANNGSGGYPMATQSLKALRQLTQQHGITLVLDATRILDNVLATGTDDLWQVARQQMACADVLTVSLAKNFAFNGGGLIATNNPELAATINNCLAGLGSGMPPLRLRMLAHALSQKEHITALVKQRAAAVAALHQALLKAGLVQGRYPGGHCVLLQMGAEQNSAELMAQIFAQTGIRAGVHIPGMQRNTSLNTCLRLAVPLGLHVAAAAQLGTDLARALRVGNTLQLELCEKGANPAEHRYTRVVETGLESFTLSEGQKGLWFLQQAEPGSSAYNTPFAYRFDKDLDPALLKQTFKWAAARHKALRTVFRHSRGEPFQMVLPFHEPDFAYSHCSHLDPQAFQQLLREKAYQPFNLEVGPLLRVQLFERSNHKVLLFVLHHLVFDGVSFEILMEDLARCYAQLLAGKEPDRPEPPKDYSHFVAAEHRFLQSPQAHTQWQFWQQHLRGELPHISWQRHRTPVADGPGQIHVHRLDPQVLDTLAQMAKGSRVSLFVLLLSAWKVLLHRHTGAQDLLVGIPMHGRGERQFKDLLGFLVNMLPIRSDLSGNPTFKQLLQQTGEHLNGAMENSQIPFAEIVKRLGYRQQEPKPLFQVGFVLQEPSATPRFMKEMGLQPYQHIHQCGELELTLEIIRLKNDVHALFKYSPNTFSSQVIKTMAQQMSYLLEHLRVDQRISNLPLWNETEKRTLLELGQGFNQRYPAQTCHQLFEQQARQQPGSIALQPAFTYEALDTAANRLAHRLMEKGLGPDKIAALCLKRTPQMVISLLAILKAGGAYLPIDVQNPTDRITYMLENARPALVLTTTEMKPGLGHRLPVVLVDDLEQVGPHHQPTPVLHRDNLAYVIYTSGSTGKPKGAALSHGAVVNYLCWARTAYQLDQNSCAPVHSSISFDATVTSLWGPLTAGGGITLISEENEIAQLAKAIVQKQTLVKLTPAHLDALAPLIAQQQEAVRVTRFVVGGEALSPATLKTWAALAPQARVVNEYGPTETAVGCVIHQVKQQQAAFVPVGRAIANCQVYVLDKHLSLCGSGSVGELFIGGTGLGRGYLDQPGLTAQRFIPHPFAIKPGLRLYASGDLASWPITEPSQPALLEMMGRVDDQVKIRGYRIELGEIEHELTQIKAVNGALVMAQPDASGHKQLIAYVTLHEPADAQDLRQQLARTLPDYMVPTCLLILENFPLTPNGKIDRVALPKPSHQQAGYVAARNENEATLAALFQDILGVERVGIHDHFFKLGGHSLSAVQLLTRINNPDLTLADIFAHATVAELASCCRPAQEAAPAVARPAVLPLSFAQERLWFIDKMEPGNGVYNIPTAFQLQGALNREALSNAFQQLMQRYDILRTALVEKDGCPQQVIHDQVPLPFQHRVAQPAELEQLIDQEVRRPFVLSQAPLWRVTLLEAGDKWILILNMHHSISDGATQAILFKELADLYRNRSLPPVTLHYADFACQQRLHDNPEQDLVFWRNYLQEASHQLNLPTCKARPATASYAGRVVSFQVHADLTADLSALAQQQGVTLFTLLLSAFATLLARMAGCLDLNLGVPNRGRDTSALQTMPGFLVTNMVMRTRLFDNPSVAQLLARTWDELQAAGQHASLPFEQLVNELQPMRDPSRNPLFQVAFSYPEPLELTLPDLACQPYAYDYPFAHFDLTLYMTPTGDGLQAALEYNTELFEPAYIQNMAASLNTLLTNFAKHPESPVLDLNLVTSDELHRITTLWNQTTTDYPKCLTQHFAQQAAANPEAIALMCDEAKLDYQTLEQHATQLAWLLLERGVGPETLVGILCPRGKHQIIALLAIVKAGGAYLALELDYPNDRLNFMLEDGGCQQVLALSQQQQRCADLGIEALFLDQPRPTPKSRELPLRFPENLAYVSYTSGSTGRPKGVAVTGAAVMRLVVNSNVGDFQASDTFLGFAPLSFDASTLEIWGALLNGAGLALFPTGQPSLGRIARFLGDHKVTICWLTAGLFHQMVDHHPEGLSGLRRLYAGGDVLSPRHVKAMLNGCPGVTLINGYGPTENTTFTTTYPMNQDSPVGISTPIGRPVSNTCVYVMDARLRPLPSDIPGELLIGGDGLARNYLGQPARTAERFVPHQNGQRLYRSGDLVRWDRDGKLIFMGRTDQQVKIRGFRIEPGEIEHQINRLDGVKKALVVLREEPKQLVAYVQSSHSATDLRNTLSQCLPAYMVPLVVVVAEFPLTANGKVDRAALPAPRPDEAQESRGPHTPLEHTLAALWCTLLGLPEMNVVGNIFELGAHSLLVTRFAARLQENEGINLPISEIFEHPTVAALAQRLAANRHDLPSIVAGAWQQFPLSFAQQSIWLLNQLEWGSNTFHMPASIRLEGPLDCRALQQALHHFVARHAIMRTTYQGVDQGSVKEVQDPSHFSLGVIALDPNQNIADWVEAYAALPFNLEEDLMLRAILLRVDLQTHVLVVVMHHIAFDGWSLGIFSCELSRAYNRLLRGEKPERQSVDLNYADYAVWQRHKQVRDLLDQQLAWWLQHIGDNPPVLQLPCDGNLETSRDKRRAVLITRLGEQRNAGVAQLARTHNATPFMVLLATFQLWLQRISGDEEVVVGTPIAGRGQAGLEDMVGCFLNSLPLRARIEPTQPFTALLKETRKTVIAAFSNQDLPFEELVKALNPERHLHRNPIFDVLFNYVNMPDPQPGMNGLHSQVEALETLASTVDARFLLELYAEEKADGLQLRFAYRAALFSEARMASFANQFTHLLDQIVANPSTRVGCYSLIYPASRAMIPDWSAPLELSWYEPVPQRLAYQRHNTAPAIRHENGSLSYKDLLSRADRVAQQLLAAGANRAVVGVAGPVSPGFIVALLGVLRAGSVLLSLDPGLPHDRRRLMLNEAQADYLLTPPGADLNAQCTLIFNSDGHLQNPVTATPCLPQLAPEDPAYIFFTSGTTGKPKGVMGLHQGLSHFLQWQSTHFALTCEDRCAQLTGLSFDVVMRDILLPLISGASLCLPPADAMPAADRILPWMDRVGITRFHTVPSVAKAWLADKPKQVHLNSVSTVFFAGEPLSAQLVDHWRETFASRASLVNLYGPTETTLAKCAMVVPHPPYPGAQPVGRAMPGAQALVLNGLTPCGINEPGEVVIRTPFRAGYLNGSATDEARFFTNPATGQEQDLLYRTGDRGRYRPDGQLELLGRLDFQVKIRGVRIEPEEVNNVLSLHPEVHQSAVLVRPDKQGEKHLYAWYVGQVDALLLREYLVDRLPEVMVPSAIMAVANLPLNANGKLDTSALPQPTQVRQHGTPAQGRVAQVLAKIWAEVLDCDLPGMEDHFFHLGGHSLSAQRIVTRVRERLAVELPLRALFQTPTLGALARVIDQNRARQTSAPTIPRRKHQNNPAPLSFSQQRLWFLDQLEGPSGTYNMFDALTIDGPLRLGLLEDVFNEITRRHQSLRTAFRDRAGQADQVIQEPRAGHVTVLDLSALDAAATQAGLSLIGRNASAEPFMLHEGHLIRVRIVRLSAASHVLLLAMSHLVSDAISVRTLVGEMVSLYEASLKGQPSPLPELPIQYADYAVWQHQYLQGEVLQNLLSWWRNTLAQAPTLLELPTRPRPAIQLFEGANLPVAIPAELTNRLQQLAHHQEATLFMVIQAALALLLYRYSGQNDVVMGTPVANRDMAQIEPLIGFFANTIALRNDLSGNPSFQELLGRTREATLEAFAHQQMPFEKLVELLQPERSLSHNPIFQVMFVLQHVQQQTFSCADLTLQPMEKQRVDAKFDLNLNLYQHPGGISGLFEYSLALFDKTTAQRMLAHLVGLLSEAVKQPLCPILSLPLMDRAERQHVLETFNSTHTGVRPECFLTRMENRVRQQPRKIAAWHGKQRLTYVGLDRRANQLAHLLVQKGITPQTAVGIYIERGLHMLVAVTAVLKTGAPYLPLDPTYPAGRLQLMIEDAQAPIILSSTALAGQVPGETGEILCLDQLDLSHCASTRPVVPSLDQNLAYLIYTSGSTGRPKGVALSRGALSNLVHWQINQPRLKQPARCLQFSSLSFDASFHEIWTTWGVGGCMVVISDALRRNMDDLLVFLARERIERLYLPFVALQHLAVAQEGGGPRPKHLRDIITSGEQLQSTQQIRSFVGDMPDCRLYNHYGPSETHVITALDMNVDTGKWQPLPSIGKPLDNNQCYILDANLQPLPVGIPGQLYLAGANLFEGYFKQPAKTAETVLPNPFGEAGSRLYTSGDLCLYETDGTIRFLGRADDQVKIRGFRIEPGEVEAAIGAHKAVREALVIMLGSDARKSLVGYVQNNPGVSLDAVQLKRFLEADLPEYMIPSAFVFIQKWPLTPSGKIDRRALPAPEKGLSDKTYAAPRNRVEQKLADIFAHLLHVTPGIHDNFFELGGHSLLATRVMSHIRADLGAALPVRELFVYPSIERLAIRVCELRGDSPDLEAIPHADRSAALPLSYSQRRLWLVGQLEGPTAAYNMTGAIRLRGPLEQATMTQALAIVTQRHESLRLVFTQTEGAGEACLRILDNSSLRLETVNLSGLPKQVRMQRANALVQAEVSSPFDLAKGPLFRARLLQLGQEDHILVVAMTHAVSDGWSISILFNELTTLYEALKAGKEPQLPQLPIQFPDYAAWQRQTLRGERLQQLTRWWLQRLEGIPQVIDLPGDRPRPARRSYKGAELGFSFEAALRTGLLDLGRKHEATLFMVLFAAFASLLHRYSGARDVVIGSSVANRNRKELENLIGFFINALPLRASFDEQTRFSDLLHTVRQDSLDAYAHAELPFDKLMEELQHERSLAYNAVFQVYMILQNAPQAQKSPAGLTVEPWRKQAVAAKFDLNLHLWEANGKLEGNLSYNTEIFDPCTAEMIVEQFRLLLEGITAHPQWPISRYNLIGPLQQQVLPPGEPQTASFPVLPSLLETYSQDPATALVVGPQSWSYAQLLTAVQRLAAHLVNQGVGPGDVVALDGPACPALIVGMLATLRLGAVMLTLDENLADERREFMLQEADARWLVHWQDHPKAGKAKAIKINWNGSCQLTGAPALPDHAKASDAAYIFFTSGTTGQPKGVLGTHAGLSHFIDWQRHTFTVAPGDRVAQLTSLTFDALLRDIFLPLCSGATLCLPLQQDLADVPVWLDEARITLCHCVPSLVVTWLASSARLNNLRYLFLSGEPFDHTFVQRWRQAFPESGELVNFYGPTETTMIKSYYLVPAEPLPGPQPAGRPLSQTAIQVVGSNGRPLGVGEIGEVLITTPFGTRGYLNQPFKTETYRTGDLGRYRSDGNLMLLGRKDAQIKIRGVRIEPAGVERVLLNCEGVRDAAVLVRDTPEGKTLAAFVVGGCVTSIMDRLRQQLARAAVPASCMAVDKIPLLSSGKRDTQELLAIQAQPTPRKPIGQDPVITRLKPLWCEVLKLKDIAPNQSFFALGGHSLSGVLLMAKIKKTLGVALPLGTLFKYDTLAKLSAHMAPTLKPEKKLEDALEQVLTQLWRSILKREEVPLDQSFFALGGHSLSAVLLMARIKKEVGVNLPMATLFKHETIQKLAACINERQATQRGEVLVCLKEGEGQPLVLVHHAGGHVLNYAPLTRYLNIPILGLESPGLSGGQLPASIPAMASSYVQALQEAWPQGPYLLGGWSLGGTVAFEMARILEKSGAQVRLILFDSRAPETAPLPQEAILAVAFGGVLGVQFGKLLELTPEELAGARDKIARVTHLAREASVIPKEYTSDQIHTLYEVFKANLKAQAEYEGGPYDGPLTLMRATQFQSQRRRDEPEDLGWQEFLGRNIQIIPCGGAHHQMFDTQHIQSLAQALSRLLNLEPSRP